MPVGWKPRWIATLLGRFIQIDSMHGGRFTKFSVAVRCPYRNLYPAVLMMKSAEDRPRGELAKPLDRPMARRILVQGQMRSEPVIIAGVGRKDLAQMGFAEDDDVIEAFPADRADQSLRMPILPGRPRGGRVIAYTHRRKTLRDRLTVDPSRSRIM